MRDWKDKQDRKAVALKELKRLGVTVMGLD